MRTAADRAKFTQMVAAGASYAKIAEDFHVSRSTICAWRKELDIPLQSGQGGRPSKLSTRDQRRIVTAITSGKVDTAPEAKRLLGLKVCDQTVRNVLAAAELHARVKQKKPMLTKRHRKRRLDWCLKHQYWTAEDWGRVIFSDETKINRWGSDGRRWCYKKKGEGLSKRTVRPVIKHGGGSVMVWGCMSTKGVGTMCNIDGIMDGPAYVKILDNSLTAAIKSQGRRRGGFIFQQDGDPKHNSALAREWFQDHHIEVMEWPAQSPDLNPIEHLWEHLKRKLNAYEAIPTSIHELMKRIEVEWKKIPVEECRKLIGSMSERIEACIKAQGGNTDW
jgi:transposase